MNGAEFFWHCICIIMCNAYREWNSDKRETEWERYLFPPHPMCCALLHHLVVAFQWSCRWQSHSMLMFEAGYLRHWHSGRCDCCYCCYWCCHQIKCFVFLDLFVICVRYSLTHFHPIRKRSHILKQLKWPIVNKTVVTAYWLLFIELFALSKVYREYLCGCHNQNNPQKRWLATK